MNAWRCLLLFVVVGVLAGCGPRDTKPPVPPEEMDFTPPEIDLGTETDPDSLLPPVQPDPVETPRDEPEDDPFQLPPPIDELPLTPPADSETMLPDLGAPDNGLRLRLEMAIETMLPDLGAPDNGSDEQPGAANSGFDEIGSGITEGYDGVLKDLSIAELVGKLSEGGVMDEAAVALASKGHEALPALLEALESKDYLTRAAAAFALGMMGSGAESALPALRKAAEEDDQEAVRGAAKYAIDAITATDEL